MEDCGHSSKTLSRSQRRRRDDIVQAALNVFERQGFEAAKMVEIAEEAGVAKGTLYLYFENKSALLEGVIETAILPTLQQIGEAAQTHTVSARDLLANQTRIAAARMASPEMKMLLRHMISGGAQNQKIISFYYENVVQKGLELIGRTLREGVESGEFKREAASIDPLILVGAHVYAAVWHNLFENQSPLDMERLVEDHLKLILNGLIVHR